MPFGFETVDLGSRVAVLTRRPGRLKALFDLDLQRPRRVEVLVSHPFMKTQTQCMDLVREETLGVPARAAHSEERPGFRSEVFLAESADAAM